MSDSFFIEHRRTHPTPAPAPKPAVTREPPPAAETFILPGDTPAHMIGFDGARTTTLRLERIKAGHVFELDDGTRWQALRNAADKGASVEVYLMRVEKRP